MESVSVSGKADTVTGTAGDDLLRWVSEAGSGSWEKLRDVCAFLAQKYKVQIRPWRLANNLAALGHIDIDWTSRTWSVAPPALNLVPGLGLCVVLTGSRPHYLDRRFDDATDHLDVFPFDIPQPHGWPTARLAKCASLEVVDAVATALRAHVVINPAAQLVKALHRIDEVALDRAPEPLLDDAQRFDPSTLRWIPVGERHPGLYQIDLHGRHVFRRLREDGTWVAVDRSVGQFLELRGKRNVLLWQSATEREASQFMVDADISLPLLAERAVTVSSGMAPKRVGEGFSYSNVPREIAEGIAEALLQELHVR